MPWGGQWWNRFFLLSHFIWLRVVLVAKCWNMQIRFIWEFGAMRQLNTISPPLRQNPTEAERSETKHRILCSFFFLNLLMKISPKYAAWFCIKGQLTWYGKHALIWQRFPSPTVSFSLWNLPPYSLKHSGALLKTAKFGQAQVGRLYEAQLTVISPVLDLFAQGSHESSAILLRCN